MNQTPPAASLAEGIAAELRDRITGGILRPGQRLSEAALAADLVVSRNTLREVFRLLTREGLLTHLPNRGVSVAVPSMAAVLDIYRVRRLIEVPAIANARPRHPAIGAMAAAMAAAQDARGRGDWQGVGSANMRFHAAIVELADSPRLTSFFAQLTAELRLAFGLIDDPQELHGSFIDTNADLLAALQAGDTQGAADRLTAYLDQSERLVLEAFARIELR
ncbi:GntR family transcriptional regulator [Paracoccus sp. 1_MG-2023]|uniref:GntR family transcriptional regulator n=1 Tax=unclassified Paracoccus (in: a-proteobacteria) TaxID=2688777 RepID=UPI001C09E672|nr:MULTISPECIES: GntR family transcriptional regulator [unclassified Paracoccus (in: a-proteobacteria)]MBU2956150.1 GntR family transcriptional regulator [Paracoccus sp. C2R09]MDO6667826.1 GntR family transcriptional regulator [Paracoccus sp. 1_MG-2023]